MIEAFEELGRAVRARCCAALLGLEWALEPVVDWLDRRIENDLRF